MASKVVPPLPIHGICDDRFIAVKDAFATNFAEGHEIGASVAVTIAGQSVVDLWAGQRNGSVGPDNGNKQNDSSWQQDTIVNVWSITKTMVTTCILMLADSGDLDFDQPVASYWPEFAANGKAGILIRHVLGHTAGLAGWTEPMKVEDLYDWEKSTGLLAIQAPLWEPGDGSGYHAVTYGYILGEIIRRISGLSPGTFFANNVAKPLGADFHIGLAEDHDDRLAILRKPEIGLLEAELSPFATRVLGNPVLDGSEPATSAWRRAEIPAAGGHGNARSVARIHSALACGGSVDGVTLLRRSGLDPIFEVQSSGIDRVLSKELRLGMGFGLSSSSVPLPGDRVFYWGGWGGSAAIIDLDHQLSISYVMNRMNPGLDGDMRSANLVLAAYTSLLA